MMQKQFFLQTAEGRTVWTDGRCKYWVGARGRGMKATSMGYESEDNRERRIHRAEVQTGMKGLKYVAGPDAVVSGVVGV